MPRSSFMICYLNLCQVLQSSTDLVTDLSATNVSGPLFTIDRYTSLHNHNTILDCGARHNLRDLQSQQYTLIDSKTNHTYKLGKQRT